MFLISLPKTIFLMFFFLFSDMGYRFWVWKEQIAPSSMLRHLTLLLFLCQKYVFQTCIHKSINGVLSFSHCCWYYHRAQEHIWEAQWDLDPEEHIYRTETLSLQSCKFKKCIYRRRFLENPCSFQFTVLKTASCFLSGHLPDTAKLVM